MSTPDPKFRTANLVDAANIVALVESAYRGNTSRAGWTTEADLLEGQRTDLEEVTACLSDPLVRIVLAESDEELLGTVLLRDEPTATYIGMLAIRPGHQARGLGRQLLERAERLAGELFCAKATRMTVIAQREELIQWYIRRGYRNTGRREPFPYGNERFGLPKRSDLEFVVLEKSIE